MRFTEHEIDQLIRVSDADGAWSLFKNMGYEEECQYIEMKYFST